MAVGDQVGEDRGEAVDRDEHVAGAVAMPARILEDQRADADQPAGPVDQRRAAPLRVRGRGEDRIVEQIFPAPRKRAPGGDLRPRHAAAPAVAHDDDRILLLEVGRVSERDRMHLERHDGAQQAETALVVVADHVGRDGVAVAGDDLGGFRLDHEVADGQDQAIVVDDDAGPVAAAPEVRDRAAVRIDRRLDVHDRRQEVVERGRLGAGRRDGRDQREHDDQTEAAGQDGATATSILHRCPRSKGPAD